MPVAILCGGRGTRLKEETGIIPKPLVRIGERPIVWHIMKSYYAQGFRRFFLLLGYKGEKIKEYFHDYRPHHSDFTLDFKDATTKMTYHSRPEEEWEVTFIDTGLEAQTGARVKRAESFLKGKPFLLTYGDGVANVDLKSLLSFHQTQGKMVTLTGVHPPGRFGEMEVKGSLIVNFREKPKTKTYINGGFFVVEPEIFGSLSDDATLNFEKDVLPRLAEKKKLSMYPHEGYWQCMDTIHDMDMLNDEWNSGRAKWKTW